GQMQALMRGRTEAEVAATLSESDDQTLRAHKFFPGARPSNAILMDSLCPETLGALIALYEHKVFVQGAIWHINSFDQWGVELGKQLAKSLEPALRGDGDAAAFDSSSQFLLEQLRPE
ncbi:MAG: glucose-6-phosphate isomerase, partial [Pseudomonadota bacterium]